jgi:hypothetical protein
MMFSMIRGEKVERAPHRKTFGALLALSALFAPASEVYAQQQDSVLKQAFKIFGFATDVGPPADFVTKTRPPSDPDYIPVFQPPPEPARPALKNDELKAVKTDLDAAGKHHDTLRQAFPPAAKALAEQQAAQKKPKSNTPSSQH